MYNDPRDNMNARDIQRAETAAVDSAVDSAKFHNPQYGTREMQEWKKKSVQALEAEVKRLSAENEQLKKRCETLNKAEEIGICMLDMRKSLDRSKR